MIAVGVGVVAEEQGVLDLDGLDVEQDLGPDDPAPGAPVSR